MNNMSSKLPRPLLCLRLQPRHCNPPVLRRMTKKSATAEASNTSWVLDGSSITAKLRAANKYHVRRKPEVRTPTMPELKNLFATSALPMVGFGFMDNFIMIQAGGYIDSTLGVKFGLATLTAAAMGQVVSDVSGVLFGSTMENFITRAGLLKPSSLSPAQRRLPVCKRVSLAGAVLGVILGCALGASSLYFVPNLHGHEEQEHLETMRETLMAILHSNDVGCDVCTLYLVDDSPLAKISGSEDDESRSGQTKVRLRALSNAEQTSPLQQQCLREGTTVISNDSADGQQIMYTPIYGKSGKEFLGFIEFLTKQPNESPERAFAAKITARHVGIIMDNCSE